MNVYQLTLFLLIALVCHCNGKIPRCKCKNSLIPREWNGIAARTNGCGAKSSGDIVPELWFHDCCLEHDRCYGTCNSDKFLCDAQFYSCMKHTCSTKGKILTRLACYAAAPVYNDAVLQLGCRAWYASQNTYCTVPC